MSIALVPGSFNPPTLGHLNIIKAACASFDKVIVSPMFNENKKYDFTVDEVVAMLENMTRDIQNVQIISWSGMLWQFALDKKVTAIVKGVRNFEDFEYEKQMAQYNKAHYNVDTLLVFSDQEYSTLSSTKVRETAKNGGDISKMVPLENVKIILEKYKK